MSISNHLNYFRISVVLFSCLGHTSRFCHPSQHSSNTIFKGCIKPYVIRYLQFTAETIDIDDGVFLIIVTRAKIK